MRLPVLIATLLPAPAAALIPMAAFAGICPVVDRGSPTDGLTTISLVQAPAPCPPDTVWPGWYCAVLQSDANDNGVSYRIGLRWNRNNQPSVATVTWLQGAGRVYHREATTYAAGVQDELDTTDGIRTVEISVLGNAFLTAPRNGFPNVSSVYADVLEFLVERGVAEGTLLHFGNSGGGMIGANALAYHELDQVLDGVVFGGSPYWADLSVTCTDPAWTDSTGRDDVDQWNWTEFNGTMPCTALSLAPDPAYGCRSTLGTDADIDYAGVMVAIIVGKTDPFLPWIDNAATDYFQTITAESKTFDRPANVGHTLMNFQGGANNVKQRIRDIVAASSVVGVEELPAAPDGLSLTPGPNPFTSATRIGFSMEHAGHVRLTVHGPAGRRVATLVDGELPAGRQSVTWRAWDDRGHAVNSGVYFVLLEAGASRRTRKIVLVR